MNVGGGGAPYNKERVLLLFGALWKLLRICHVVGSAAPEQLLR